MTTQKRFLQKFITRLAFAAVLFFCYPATSQTRATGRYQCYILSHILSKSNILKEVFKQNSALPFSEAGALYEQPLILSDINDFPFNIYFTLPKNALITTEKAAYYNKRPPLPNAFFAFMNKKLASNGVATSLYSAPSFPRGNNQGFEETTFSSSLFATLTAGGGFANPMEDAFRAFGGDDEATLIIAFRLEEVVDELYDPFDEDTLSLDKKESFLSLLVESLAKTQKHCRVIVLFTYGDEARLISPTSISGTDAFLDALIDKDNKFALCVTLKSSGENSITSGGSHTVAPSHLLRLVTDAFYNSLTPYSIKGGSISTMHRLDLLQTSPRANKFLAANIPTCAVEFNTLTTAPASIAKVLTNAAVAFGKGGAASIASSDKRSLGIKLGQKTFWISERLSITLFLIFTGLSILLLIEFTLSLRSGRGTDFHKQMIRDITHLIYLIPLTIAVMVLALFLGQSFSTVLYKAFSLNIFARLSVKTFMAFFLVSLYFVVILQVQGALISSAYSYFILVVALFNIYLFTSIDISLFYLFLVQYIIVFFSRFAQKTLKICLFFVVMCLPLVPYAIQFVKYLKSSTWDIFINSSFSLNLLTSLFMLPFALVWLRILVRLNSKWASRKLKALTILRQNTLSVAGFVLILIGLLIAVVRFIPLQYKERANEPHLLIKKREGMVTLSIEDHKYFDETSRALHIECLTESERLIVLVRGNVAIPITYSDYPFVTYPATKTCVFKLPPNCPKSLTLNYIAQSLTPATVKVIATFPDGKDEYNESSASIFTMR